MDWVFPAEIDGWLTEHEGRKLADLARGKRVLEIGSFRGRSTVCMAQTADSVVCVDPFDGRATSKPGDTFQEFSDNIARYNVADRVLAYRGTSSIVSPKLQTGSFDLVFIDGAHDYDSLTVDIGIAERVLAPGGLIAFHDYRRPIDRDVTATVDIYLNAGAELLELVDTVAVVRPRRVLGNGVVRQPRKEEKVKPLVFLGMPSYDGKCSFGAAEGYFIKPTLGKLDLVRAHDSSSFLTKSFNTFWTAALNARCRGVTHFAMIHADIIPHQFGWLDILYSELVERDADVVSVVSPIKSQHGWTSTAIGDIGLGQTDSWNCRRLTLHEVYKLPETFDAADVQSQFGYEGGLLLNTGLWICRLDRPWCDNIFFDVFNRMIRNPDGSYHRHALSEDWLFSAVLNLHGAKICATRKVTLTHDGCAGFTSDHAWGTEQTDQVFVDSISATRGQGHAEDQVHEGLSGEGNDLGPGAAEPEAVAGVRGG